MQRCSSVSWERLESSSGDGVGEPVCALASPDVWSCCQDAVACGEMFRFMGAGQSVCVYGVLCSRMATEWVLVMSPLRTRRRVVPRARSKASNHPLPQARTGSALTSPSRRRTPIELLRR